MILSWNAGKKIISLDFVVWVLIMNGYDLHSKFSNNQKLCRTEGSWDCKLVIFHTNGQNVVDCVIYIFKNQSSKAS